MRETARLTQAAYETTKTAVLEYLKTHESITNRELRALTKLDYDQAIAFFNRIVSEGTLHRVGKTSSIKYVLPPVV